jgi:hypothetical protein
MYPIRTTTNHKNGKSTQNIKPKTASASNTATQQPQRGLTSPKAIIGTPLPNPATPTGVSRLVVVLSPTCTKHNTSRQLQPRAPPATHNSPLKNSNKHHLAISIPSPARHRAAAGQRTGMFLQNITSHPHAPFSRNNVPHPHNNQSQKR